MENFKKNMQEAWPGTKQVDAPWTGKPNHDWSSEIEQKKKYEAEMAMKRSVAAAVRDEILADFNNKHTKISDIVDDPSTKLDTRMLKLYISRHLGDEIAANDGPIAAAFEESDYNEVIDMMNTYGEDEEPEEKSDMEDNPGVSIGQDAKWK